jgi:hypothetical protein
MSLRVDDIFANSLRTASSCGVRDAVAEDWDMARGSDA